ncbi:MAG: cyclodeaminase [Deltaproteobacteria bacterium]|uniref:cyclodeaminase n=1 Tax=Desulfobacula sp. TaxID=2593537 RepID=UPI0019B54A2A|nr:cyclodeaminase [Candidatus Desulfobacula maris]MBL6992678.1 cyclodeaminase [Desulfobacula sp.]
MSVLILTEKELRNIVRIDQASIDAVANAFSWLSKGLVTMPPIMHIEIPEHKGDVDIKSAYVKGLDRFAVKIGAGFFHNFKLGLPSSPAMMVVLSAKTGMAEAILLDNAYLTDVRTAAAGAVAARHLAPEKVFCAGVIGAGAQGRYQMMALKQVRDFKQLMVYDLDQSLLDQYVKDMTQLLDVEVIAAQNVKEVITQSQTVVTCTPSKKPFLDPAFLHPGLHITAIGADLPEKQEIMSDVFAKADIIACDIRSQGFSVGELFNARSDGIQLDENQVLELGDIISGSRKGRQSQEQITICDLSGTGVQDTAIADLALKQAESLNLGIEISMD